MLDETAIGLMYISESYGTPSVSNIDSKNTSDLFYVTFDTNLQDFDVKNRNQRYYDANNIMDCINTEKIQSLLACNGWFGEFDHPAPLLAGEKLSPERIQNVPPDMRAFKIMSPHLEGNILKARIQSAQGSRGEGFGKEVLAGWIPQFSARAIASMIMKNNKPYVMVKKLITYDAPWYPSHKVAHATSEPVVTSKSFNEFKESVEETIESAVDKINDIMVPLKDILLDVGKKDPTTEMICEAFDLTYDNLVGFSDDHKQVIVRDDTNRLFINVNPDTVKMINDFYTSF